MPPLQWLEQWGRETERPPYRDPALHFNAPRLTALRGGDMNGETPAKDNEGGMLMRRACARTLSPRSFLLLEHSLQPTPRPTLRTSLTAPAWRLPHVSRRLFSDLTWRL